MKKRMPIFTAALSAMLLLSACGAKNDPANSAGGDEEKTGDTYTIGVTQIVEHPSLDAAFEGFQKAIEDAGLDVEYDKQNAQNDNSSNSTIANNLVGAGVDLIFANSTPSALAAAGATSDIPIIFTSVTDAVEAGLVASNEKPGSNVTGTIDNHPEAIPNTLQFLKDQLGSKKVGMLFNSGEQNSRLQIDKAKSVAKELGIDIVEASVATSADVKQAAESLVGSVDSLYVVTDNTVVSALESVIAVANDNSLPLMVGELDSVARGGLGAYGFEYYDIGYEAGEMAVKVLTGEAAPDELPVQVPQNLKLLINSKTAEQIGLKVEDSWNAETTD